MSWLGQSLANTLRLGDDEDDHSDDDFSPNQEPTSSSSRPETSGTQREGSQSPSYYTPEEDAERRHLQQDFTELGQALSRQLFGVASFFAPPSDKDPHHRLFIDRSACDMSQSELPDRSPGDGETKPSVSVEIAPIGIDESEMERNLSSVNRDNLNVTSSHGPFESERGASSNLILREESEEEEEEEQEEEEDMMWENAIGITDEVLGFATNIAMHPETWLDFPLDPDEDLDDFDMSDAQREHSMAIERLSPRLAALRNELCPWHMSLSYFWKVYFVLLHSRLNKHDTALLYSPQVMEARALWMKELHRQAHLDTDSLQDDIPSAKTSNSGVDDFSRYAPPEFLSPRIYSFEPPSIMKTDFEMVQHSCERTEAEFVDKPMIEQEPVCKTEDKDVIVGQSSKAQVPDYEEEDDEWPEDEDSDCERHAGASFYIENEDDVSFSDLEGDDDISSLRLKCKMTPKATEPFNTAKNP